ncbi:alkaline phosphatase [uncultured Cellulomonas sp.]|uniref:alkaline phosphatase n=1 Tax=uncultured Cellulomonas sp. TaxID=189682 RepID=UPI0028F14E42|nr:alkaline phosphatase [uncultured Cellulomonas sp.]
MTPAPDRARPVRALVAAAVVAALALFGFATPASADDPVPSSSGAVDPTVTADGLPTVQIDGVAWAQIVVGTTVYVAGDFTTARPAGAAAGEQTTPRSHLLAYDVTTGELLTGWAPVLNGPAYSVAASPDGTRIYVGGDFTSVNGVARNRFAVLDATTGALVTAFTGGANAAVRSIVATATTVYIAGNFNTVAGQSRPRVAAFDTTTAALTTWRVSVQPRQVDTILLSQDASTLYIGGRFDMINGVARQGIGAVSTSTAALTPWTVNPEIFAYGYSAGIMSLATDGNLVYGTGFGFLTDPESDTNLEGMFAADPVTADLAWVEDCHGDTYSVYANPGKDHVYIAGHPHHCSNFGGFPEVSPRRHQYGVAFTKSPVGKIQPNSQGGYYDMQGFPAPAQRTFWPTFTEGTFTGLGQATWSVTGADEYVVYGGEFLRVNGVEQQGLVRFATPDVAPNDQGPVLSGSATQPTAASRATGTMQVSWPANWDKDDGELTYQVFRNNGATPVYTTTRPSRFWDRSRMSFTDSGLANSTSYTYKVVAVDAAGNEVTSPNVTATTTGASAGALGAYAAAVLGDNPAGFWRLSETSGPALDWSAYSSANVGNSVTRNQTGAIFGDTNRAMAFTGAGTSRAYSTVRVPGPMHFTVEAWFRTTSTSGGKIVGFGSTSGTTDSSSYDRHVYLGADGRVSFGVYPSTARAITSPAAYNDGAWHQVMASVGDRGMELYLDGALVATNPDVTFGQAYDGYWRIGGDSLGSWPNAGATSFNGTIDDVSVYGRQLDLVDVVRHQGLGATGVIPNLPPRAKFTVTGGELSATSDASASDDLDGTIASYDWAWGDGGTSTGATSSHTYATGGTYDVTLTVTDDDGTASSLVHQVVVANPNVGPTPVITSSSTGLTGLLDATASSDPDGTIESYQWNFGDGTTGSGHTVAHAYGGSGIYTVSLTVTDDDGVASTTTAPLTIIAPVVDVIVANDTFTRTVSPGWGSADQGGAWTTTAGAGSVSGTQGVSTIAAANGSFSGRLTGVSGTDQITRFSTTVDKRPAGSGGWILSRGRITPAGEYRLKVNLKSNGTVTAAFVRTNAGGTETVVTPAATVAGLTYSAGSVVRTALKVSGGTPTTLSAKVWIGTEPADWQLTATDSTAGLQESGHTGLAYLLSSTATNAPVAFRTDDYTVLSVGTAAPPETQIPPDDPTPTLPAAQTGTPKNIITLVGDGMGYNTVDLGSVFQSGKTLYQQKITNGPNLTKIGGQGATQPYQYFAVQAGLSTFPSGGSYSPSGNWSSFTQPLTGPTDSAAAATALSSGLKTNNEVIGKDATGKDIRSIASLAQDVGKATGVVTTKYLSDATPAGYLAHEADRGSYTAIADDLVASNANVVFGTGNPLYDNDAALRATPDYTYISQSTWEDLTTGQTPYTFVDTVEEFDALATGETPEQVFGVPHAFTTLQASRSGLVATSVPFSTPRNQGVPSLVQMSRAALNVLDDDPDGFFVMIEGGAIDSAAHENNTAGVVEEQVEFNDAVQAVVDWVETSSSWDETLVIVTADHETGYLWGPGSNPVRNPIVGTAGTAPAVQWNTVNHSNQLVPFYATGVGSAAFAAKATGTDPVRGAYLDNTDVGAASLAFWGGLPGDAPTVHVPPPPPPLASDTFERTVAGAFGTADVGGAWVSTASATSVGSGTGVMALAAAGGTASARLPGVASASHRETVTFSLDKRPSGSGGWVLLRGRVIDGAGDYRLKLALSSGGSVSARLFRTNAAGTETAIASSVTATGVSYAAGTQLKAAIEVVGTSPTTIRAKVWPATGTEPTTWLTTATDTTAALQAPGYTGLAAILSSTSTNVPVTVRFDDYTVTTVS